MSEIRTNKTIAWNTLFLYFRMALVTVVGLFTSRVILQFLGINDYGIYNVAGSIVALFSFLTGALGGSSSRFITIEIGKVKDNDHTALINCFKTTRSIHAILASFVFIIAESIGLWVLYMKCNIPADRLTAAMWVYQMSVLTSLLNITQIPFTALIIAHERMSIYAYVSIFEVTAKLLVCYLLVISPIDKLVFYAILLLIVQILTLGTYRIYCIRNFAECKLGYHIDKTFFKPLMSFSFWNLFGSLSYSALTQGATILISFFFNPALVAARSIANVVKNQVSNFVNNFRLAVNPQILKRHSSGDIEGSRRLLFFSCNISFYLMLIIVLPLLFETQFVLRLWLDEVPQFTTEFLQIVLLEMLVYVYDVTFYQIFQAEGRLKENAIICPITDFIVLAIIYVLYKYGGSVLWIAWGMLFLTIVQGMIVKPYLAVSYFAYEWRNFIRVYLNNLCVLVASLPIPALITCYKNEYYGWNVLTIVVSVISACASAYILGFNKQERLHFNQIIMRKFLHQ